MSLQVGQPSVLEVTGLVAGYGKRKILADVSLTVASREIATIVGPNGAGKSTLLKAIFGLNDIFSGRILLDGTDITGRAPYRNVADKLLFLPQGNRAFEDLTVEENLLMGGYSLRRDDALAQLVVVYQLFPELSEMKRRYASTLSGGERQMLALGRALVLQPKLLLLDEPSVGLDPGKVKDVMAKITVIRDQLGCSILVVEQKVKQVLEIADRVISMKLGRIAFTGTPEEFKQSAGSLMVG